MTTTTAALDGQSKPNHMTMIGAMPTIGSALTRLPIGSRPRCRNGTRSTRMATRKPRAAADARSRSAPPSGRSGGNRRQSVGSEATMRAQICARRRQEHRRHAEAAHDDLPEDQEPEAEEERDERRRAARRAAALARLAAPRAPARRPRRSARRRRRAHQKPRPAWPATIGSAAMQQDRRRRARRRRSGAAASAAARALISAAERERAGGDRPAASPSPPARSSCTEQHEGDERDGDGRIEELRGAPFMPRMPMRRSTMPFDERRRCRPARRPSARRRPAPPRSARSGRNRSRSAAARRARPPRRSAARRRWRRRG